MTSVTTVPPDVPPETRASVSTPRPMLWSVWREIQENRSVYMAPLIVTAVILFGFLLSLIWLPHRMERLPVNDPIRAHVQVYWPFSIAAAIIMLTTFVVGLFYSLDALYGERRDRSILFWKSLPVSDATAVLSKAAIPLAVLPLIAFLLSAAVQAVMLLLSTMVLAASDVGAGVLWSEFPFLEGPLVMMYGLGVHTLWFAPVYCWLLLISAWAKRAPLLWAVLPVVAIGSVETMAFRTGFFCSFMKARFLGAISLAFAEQPKGQVIFDRLSQLTPGRFLGSASLWVGLLLAALFLAAAVRLRRNREPI